MTTTIVGFAPDYSDVRRGSLEDVASWPARHQVFRVTEEDGTFRIKKLIQDDGVGFDEPTVDDVVHLYNAAVAPMTGKVVKKFETKEVGVKRTVKGIMAGLEPIEVTKEVKVSAVSVEMPAKKRKVGSAPKVRQGRPAKSRAELKTTRRDTNRGRVLEQMDGSMTPAEIAAKVGLDEKTVIANAVCNQRDLGIGFEYLEGGRIAAVYPEGAALSDVIKG